MKQVNSSAKRSPACRDGESGSDRSVAADSGTLLSAPGIIYSLFQAQFRSVVKCPVCHKESTSVEPLLLVPLSLTDASFSLSVTVVHSHPQQSIDTISVNIISSGTIRDLRCSIAAASGIPAKQVCYIS